MFSKIYDHNYRQENWLPIERYDRGILCKPNDDYFSSVRENYPLLNVIFISAGHLWGCEAKQYIASIPLVCKLWQNVFEYKSLPILFNSYVYRLIDLPGNDTKYKTLNYAKTHTSQLQVLNLEGVKDYWFNDIKSLSAIFSQLKVLIIENFNGNMEFFKDFISLKELKIINPEDSGTSYSLPDLGLLTSLEKLTMKGAWTGLRFPSLTPNLKEITVECNPLIRQIPSLNSLVNLKALTIKNNKKLSTIASQEKLIGLKKLSIVGNEALSKIPSLDSQIKLERLTLCENGKINSFPSFKELKKLEDLSLSSRVEWHNISELNELIGLKKLAMGGELVRSFSSIKDLTNLNELILERSETVKEISVIGFSNLEKVIFFNNENLAKIILGSLPRVKEVLIDGKIINSSEFNNLPELNDHLNQELSLYQSKRIIKKNLSGDYAPWALLS